MCPSSSARPFALVLPYHQVVVVVCWTSFTVLVLVGIFCALTTILQTGGKLTLGELKHAGKTEVALQRSKLKQAKARSSDSRKGLTKADIVEEAEKEYLSMLTGKDLTNAGAQRAANTLIQ